MNQDNIIGQEDPTAASVAWWTRFSRSIGRHVIRPIRGTAQEWWEEAKSPTDRPMIAFLLILIGGTPFLAMGVDGIARRINEKHYVIATGSPSGGYVSLAGPLPKGSKEPSGQAPLERLVTSTSEGVVRLTPRPTGGAFENLRLLKGGLVDFGFVQGGLGYKDSKSTIYSVAKLYRSVLYVVASRKVGDLDQVMAGVRNGGLKMCLGPKGSGTESVMRQIADLYGIPKSTPNLVLLAGFDQIRSSLTTHKIDVAAMLLARDSDLIRQFGSLSDFNLVDIGNSEGIAWRIPALKYERIPKASVLMYPAFPARDTHTVAVCEYLLCNDGIRDKDVYSVLEALQKLSPQLSEFHNVDLMKPEDDFPYPLHPGAIEYYLHQPKPSIRALLTLNVVISSTALLLALVGGALLLVRRWRTRPYITAVWSAYRTGLAAVDAQAVEDALVRLATIRAAVADLYAAIRINDDDRRRVTELITVKEAELLLLKEKFAPPVKQKEDANGNSASGLAGSVAQGAQAVLKRAGDFLGSLQATKED